uniref:Uncharacterized protein n=1 Tax=Cannabis sativa TaxID=3483 RepID=A0A803PC65_CANSA
MAPFTQEDIHQAVTAIGATKASRLDEYHAYFFQRFWDIVGERARFELMWFRCSRSGPRDTHLFFADSSLVFGRANRGGSGLGSESVGVDISDYS